MSAISFPGLTIESPFIFPEQVNSKPFSWPPTDDWPVVMDRAGQIVSRWIDSIWVLDSWAGKRCILNFGDGKVSGKAAPIDVQNANLLRTVTSWWLYGVKGVRSASTLVIRFTALRPLFAFCSEQGILASELKRYPHVVDKLHAVFMPSASELVMSLLHELYAHAETVGFELLGKSELIKLATGLPARNHEQTPYIPPRIWKYQAGRLRSCLDDFHAARSSIEGLFAYALDAYVKNYGSLSEATRIGKSANIRPFINREYKNSSPNMLRLGAFQAAAEKFGVASLLNRWVGVRTSDGFKPLAVDQLSSYFTLVNWAGLAYILNFTLMRIDEAMSLKSDCLLHDDDPRFGRISLIVGETSKTVRDKRAHWVTAESSEVAISAMRAIAGLRLRCRTHAGPDRLMHPVSEPWAGGARPKDEANRPLSLPYAAVMERYPLLFDTDELRITGQDLKLARLATPSLPESFKEGAVWPLAWHQLRRTGAMNMQASGLVSEASLQFQLKHLSRAMSLYYGQNHARVHLEETARAAYVQAMYETLGRELQAMASDRFVSPHGQRRKSEILKLISVDELKQTVKLAKRGGVACREIVLGACMSLGPCEYGGIDSVAHCGGGDGGKPCIDVLYDKSKSEQVKRLDSLLDERLTKAQPGSPLYESLSAQKRSTTNYFLALQAVEE